MGRTALPRGLSARRAMYPRRPRRVASEQASPREDCVVWGDSRSYAAEDVLRTEFSFPTWQLEPIHLTCFIEHKWAFLAFA